MYSPFVKPVSYVKSFRGNVRVGIVGSRNYGNEWLIKLFVAFLPKYVTIVSGYGGIVDKTAIGTAKRLHMKYKEHRPDLVYRKRGAGARNKMIAQDDLCCLIAFIDTTRSSGTVKTIEYALKEKVKVFVIKSDPLADRPTGRRPRCIVLKRSKNRRKKRQKSA